MIEGNSLFELSADDIFGGSVVNVKVADSSALDYDVGITKVSFIVSLLHHFVVVLNDKN